MRNNRDTIAAIATPNGEGGIAIVRISGPEALPIAERIFRPSQKSAAFEHGRMLYGYAVDADGSELDEVMAVYFQAPRSYTRQDVCEIHTHGGVSSALVLERAVKEGARPAERGEFTYRAFINGRIDLSRAEAVMEYLINQGIDPDRLEAVGYGPDKPIAPNNTAKGRAKNRRTEFNIIEQ